MASARTSVMIGIAVAAGVSTWLLVTHDAPEPSPATPSPAASVVAAPARIVTPTELAELAAGVNHPVFWIGERTNRRMEWMVQSDGAAIVNYVSTDAGTERPEDVISVASYPLVDAVSAVEQGAQLPGAVSDVLPGGTLATAADPASTNAFFAVPNVPVLVEIYSPRPGKAYDLIRSSRLETVPQP